MSPAFLWDGAERHRAACRRSQSVCTGSGWLGKWAARTD